MFDTIIPSTGLDMTSSLICTGVSIALGALSAFLYRLGKKRCSNSLTITLVVLPAMVQTVIMLVNGSVGAGLAVMGAFSLVRFRSTPGNARDICFIFYSMCIGLATGMGYIAFAVMLAVTVGIVLAVLGVIPQFRDVRQRKMLRITIPEDMNYTDAFSDIFDEFLSSSELVMVKSTAMGTLFDLRYEIVEKDAAREKELIDKLRTRNGNLTISIGLAPDSCETL
jgi:uncharacterized membrane protein YhiD involved in acid resistance